MELDLLDLVVFRDLPDLVVLKVSPDPVDPKDLSDHQVNQDREDVQVQLDYKDFQVVLELLDSLVLLDALEQLVPVVLLDSQDPPDDQVCLVTQDFQEQMDSQDDQVGNHLYCGGLKSRRFKLNILYMYCICIFRNW